MARPSASLRKDATMRAPMTRTDRRSVASSSPTAARSPSASSAPAATWASRRSPSTAMRTRTPPHVRLADVAVRLGPAPRRRELPAHRRRRRRAALASGAEASTRATDSSPSARRSPRRSRTRASSFVGPAPATIAALGDKLDARRLARRGGVPVVPGTLEPGAGRSPRPGRGDRGGGRGIGYPLLVKAAAGGGGRGMRRVERPPSCRRRWPPDPARRPRRSATAPSTSSGRSRPARHVEVQLLADAHGTVVALGERDCSLQRRHQKLVEEAPAPGLSATQRRELHAMAIRLGAAAGLRNAATCEFLLDPDGRFWFLEVNTRLQVEHGVTELVAGVDIVREQFWLAAGPPLADDVVAAARARADPKSHAIEVRITAEDPSRAFAPTPGRVAPLGDARGPGRPRRHRDRGRDRVPPEYDNLIAKLLVHGADRDGGDRSAAARPRRDRDRRRPDHACRSTGSSPRDARSRPADLSTGWVDEHWDGAAARRRPSRGRCSPPGSPLGRRCLAMSDRRRRAGRRPRRIGDARPRPAGDGAPRRPGSIGAWPAAGRRDRRVRPRGRRDRRAPARPDRRDAGRVPGRTRSALGSPRRRPADGRPSAALRKDGPRRWAPADDAAGPGARHARGRGRQAASSGPLRGGRPRAGGPRGPRRRLAVRGRGRARAAGRAPGAGDAGPGGRRRGRAAGGPGDHPGQVVAVSVADGDRVEAGQQLLVVEAMKMQNELRAPRAGTIERVGVAEGAEIEIGDLLVVISEAPDGPVTRRAPDAPGAPGDDPAPRPLARPPERRERSPRPRRSRSPTSTPPADVAGLDPARDLGLPGEYPFTRGVQADHVPRPVLDDAPVRGVRDRRRDQRALPLPPRPGPDRPVGRLRPADPDGLRLRRPARRRARSAGSASRSARWPTWRPCSRASRSARSARR